MIAFSVVKIYVEMLSTSPLSQHVAYPRLWRLHANALTLAPITAEVEQSVFIF